MFRLVTVTLGSLFLLSACASGTFKARQEQRDKIASSAGMYCEFVNGDQFPDVDVELNMQMARRCDADGHFTITNYKNSSEQAGVIYCCSMLGQGKAASKKEKATSSAITTPPTAASTSGGAPAAAAKPAEDSK